MMKILLVVLASFLSITFCTPLADEWMSWKLLYNKNYATQEEELRRQIIWKANKEYVEEHNAQKDKFGYTLKMNQFGDLSEAEFSKLYNGFRMDLIKNRKNMTKLYVPKNVNVPTSWDWRDHGYVTGVKNQGQCGSCWSFATTGSLEGQYYKSKGSLISLSEQQLVDCTTSYGEHGCKGGNVDVAFTYIKSYGIESEADYPYTAEDGYCMYDSSKIVTKITSYVDVNRYSESDLLEACYENGPIAVAIDASHQDFQLYNGGVYSNTYCSSTSLDHGVLVVGFGNYNGQDYWLVKNSWGESWGIDGYFMLARNQNNMCGVATLASYPVI